VKYRPEIDGLRAIAVVLVILSHAGIKFFNGGFIGVDLFFVISGYLITTIIIEDLEKREFSIGHFYERRIRRIIPALSVVIFFSSIAAWFLLSSVALNKYGDAVIGVSLFFSNFIFWRQQGYFDESSELSPLLHTWSLAVEEQYYLLFPIFLLLFWRFGKRNIFWMIVIMSLISFLICEWGWRNKPTPTFYLLPTRAWELFLGSISSIILLKMGQQKNELLSFLGISAIIFSAVMYNSSTPFPSVYTLIPVAGAMLVIIFCSGEIIVAQFLKIKIFVGIGLISYSAYLWHQPLFAFTRILLNKIELDIYSSISLIVITFFVSFMSWKFIERPFRNKLFLDRRKIFLIAFISTSSLLFVGYVSKIAVKGHEYKLAKILSENEFVYYEDMNDRKFIEGRLMYNLESVDIVVVGSSRVMQINSETFNQPIYNLSMSGSSIEDNIAISLEAVAKINPRSLYISADPWLYNKNYRSKLFRESNKLYKYWLNRIKNDYEIIPYYSDMKNIYYLNPLSNFIVNLRNKIFPVKQSISHNGDSEIYSKKAHDGYHIYNLDSENTINNEFFLHQHLLMRNFKFNLNSEKILDELISYLKKNNIKTSLILSPYHPDLYKMMTEDSKVLIEIESQYNKIAKKNNIEIVGSYNPHIVGCKKNEFYDGAHPRSECISKIFKFENKIIKK
tara:strand:+ start:277 stop:2301 length:2025 start_codon:yes stop_codon:yes gene_type:complete